MPLLRLLPPAVGLGLFLSATPVVAQAGAEATYRGRVVDVDGRALAGASVLVKDTHTAASTNADGLFQLTLPAGVYTFVAEYPVHRKAELVVQRPDSLYTITLHSTQARPAPRR